MAEKPPQRMTLLQRLRKAILFLRLVGYGLRTYYNFFSRSLSAKIANRLAKSDASIGPDDVKNIVIVGAAFSGLYAARLLAGAVPRDGRYRIVVIEPNSHFNFTWVFPRFCVVEGHEHKAFIPYSPDFFDMGPKGLVQWVRDRVTSLTRENVLLRSGEVIPYEYLIIATGSNVADGLPSRAGVEDKEEAIELLKAMQERVKNASHIVVAGGGAAGVETATDAKDRYPGKSVTIVHSRQALMHRFGNGLQQGTSEAMERLGVNVILGEKVLPQSVDGKFITLSSGRKIECDCFINCTGQKPASGIVASLAPNTITPSGHIRVKPNLQIDDDSLPNVYVCGDVAQAEVRNPNSRVAARQAEICADNVVRAVKGKKPKYVFTEGFGDGVIKLTLGLDRSITQYFDGKSELLFPAVEPDLDLMCKGTWAAMGARPFEDTGVYSE
ncbi:hypothetical protein QC761_700150 [Podospora bellae-mahoneyi]|uniref:FAD/NAD(P)-binding domain-containing protein n=1 Tax=Podospora bellae-mahoneyi TaxID=2093777 RepID=A0ABR0F8G2_9PEZI|nr:hypothetical protein QC761_700150 [Podospora bellae-mahoneyi]